MWFLRPLCGAAVLAAALSAQPALTVYNQDFAMVRERVPLRLKAGENEVAFAGVTTQLEADSVILRDPTGRVKLRVLEQSYRADVMAQDVLLARHEGRELDFLIRDQNAKEYTVRGKVIRSGHVPGGQAVSPIISVDGKLRFSLPGEPLFPALAGDGILRPTLTWRLASDGDAQCDAELGYVTGGLNWQAAYNLVAPEQGDTVDIVGWISIDNHSGQSFEGAVVKLMAGSVNRVGPSVATGPRARGVMLAAAMADNAVTEKAFDEFHLYGLPRPVTLRDRETKLVEFMRATAVKAPVIYVYDGAQGLGGGVGTFVRDAGYGTESNRKVAVMREIRNREENGLGLALPQGRVRFYRRDEADGRLEFTGENSIDHTPRNEVIRLKTGDAFDVLGERVRTEYQSSSRQDFAEETFEIRLKNRKAVPIEVRVVEHLYRGRNWTISVSSLPFEKQDAQTIVFKATVAPDSETQVRYRVRYEAK